MYGAGFGNASEGAATVTKGALGLLGILCIFAVAAGAWWQREARLIEMPYDQATAETRCRTFGTPINPTLTAIDPRVCAMHWRSCARFLWKNIQKGERQNEEEFAAMRICDAAVGIHVETTFKE